MRYFFVILNVLCFVEFSYSQGIVRGKILDEDTTQVLPFVYVINKNTNFGTVSDDKGFFSVKANEEDTLIFSYTGYVKQYIPVQYMKKVNYTMRMKKSVYSLKPITISVLRYENYEKDYMKRVIDKTQMPLINALSSPITALYMQFSKKGREMQRLSRIFEDILIKEQVERKVNSQILYQLTGDANVDIEALRKYCGFYLSDYYILNHDGYDLYSRVLECYYRYKYEKEQ